MAISSTAGRAPQIQPPDFIELMRLTNLMEESVASGDVVKAQNTALALMQSGKALRIRAILLKINPLPIAEKLIELLGSSAIQMERELKFAIAKTARLFVELTFLKSKEEKWILQDRTKSGLIGKIKEIAKPLKKKANEEDVALRHELDCTKAKLKLMKSDESIWGGFALSLLKVLDGDFGSGIDQALDLSTKLNKSFFWIGQVHYIYFMGMECIANLQMLQQLQSYMRSHLQKKQIALCAVNVFADLIENGAPEIQLEAFLGEPGLLSLSKVHATNSLNTLWPVRYLALQYLIVFTSHPNPSIKEKAIQRLCEPTREEDPHVKALLFNYRNKPELEETLKMFFKAKESNLQGSANSPTLLKSAVEPRTKNGELANLLAQLLENSAVNNQPELFNFLGNKYDLLIARNMADPLDEGSVALHNQLTQLLKADNQINQFVANRLTGQRTNAPQTPSDSDPNNNSAPSSIEQKAAITRQAAPVIIPSELPVFTEQLLSQAKEGNANAQFIVGMCYAKGLGIDQDCIEAIRWYGKAALQGYARAQNNLGGLYYKLGELRLKTPRLDYSQATRWYRKAAKQGDAEAQCNLGWCYESGRWVVTQDYAQAVHWYRQAAKQKNTRAYCYLGMCYEKGQGVTQDHTQATYWYEQAVKQGDVNAQFHSFVTSNVEQGLRDLPELVLATLPSAVIEASVLPAFIQKLGFQAKKGDADAQYWLGISYSYGEGVSHDDKWAVYWISEAAKNKNPKAQTHLGWWYEEGIRVAKDDDLALRWYGEAASLGDADGLFYFGVMNSRLHPLNTISKNCYEKAARQGHEGAACALERHGGGTEDDDPDYEEAVRWYREGAKQGDVRVQNDLGSCYAEGKGVPQNHQKAAHWYRKAAKQRHAEIPYRIAAYHGKAQYNLGWCYENGKGVVQDYIRAVHWYRRAEMTGNNSGNTYGAFRLAWCYANGKGVFQDYDEAAYLYLYHQYSFFPPIQPIINYNLGWCYENGKGVSQDLTEAVLWYKEAAEGGNAEAQHSLAKCYFIGQGVAKDYSQAVHWYKQAAEGGNTKDQCALGRCYITGQGVARRDFALAEYWYGQAAKQGKTTALIALAVLKRHKTVLEKLR